MINRTYLLLIVFLGWISLYPQSIPEPVYNTGIYDFLENLSVKGIILLNDNIKPFSRSFIADKLRELDEKKEKLTHLETEYLDFYKREYFYEIGEYDKDENPELIKKGESGRWRVLKYAGKNFYAYVDPILGLEFSYTKDSFLRHRWNGVKAGGYIGENWGYYLDFRDNEDYGSMRDSLKNFTRETGANIINETRNSIEYSEVRGGISYSWANGSISLQKEFLNWGSGRGGQLIFSSKAPSFPFLQLTIQPAEWVSFSYIHGFLQSGIIDSSTIRGTLVERRDSYSDIPKFIASHIVSFNIYDNLILSLGESVVYSERIEPVYLIPVMFFRLADHYMSKRRANSGDNAQLFADAFYKNSFIRTKFYGTLFIDELSITSLLKGVKLNALGYTVGLEAADPIIKNSSVTLEYTRLNPFVYMNSNDAQLYTNHGYQMGHWIGSNADQVYFSYTQKFLRGLELNISGDYIRKGKREDPADQYKLPYPDFLYGDRRDLKSIRVTGSYEIIHDLFVRGSFINERKNRFSFGLWYGI